MKNNNKNTLMWGIVIIVVAIILVNTGVLKMPKFAIVDSDFICESPLVIYLPDVNFNVTNLSITYNDSGISRSLVSGQVYYKLDNDAATIYSVIPDVVGTHTIYKYTIEFNETMDTISLQKCSILYAKELQNVTSEQICTAISGIYLNATCTCPGGSTWDENSTTKVCPPVVKTVSKEVKVEPTFFEKYGIAAIILVIALVIILFPSKNRRKK